MQQWRKGSEPSAFKLKKICEYLDVDINYILDGKTKRKDISDLNNNEIEMLEKFNKLTEREQIKEIARLELIVEQQEEIEREQISKSKLSI